MQIFSTAIDKYTVGPHGGDNRSQKTVDTGPKQN